MSNSQPVKILKLINEFELILNLGSDFSEEQMESIQMYFEHILYQINQDKAKLKKHIRVNTQVLTR